MTKGNAIVLRILSIVSLTILLSSCASYYLKPLNENYQLITNPEEGVVFFSAGMKTNKSYFGLFPPELLLIIGDVDDPAYRKQVSVYPSLSSDSNDVNDDGKQNLFAVSLPSGHYEISSMVLTQSSSWALGSQGVDIEFEVKPNSVSYIGSYRLDVVAGALMDSRAGALLVVKNEMQRDFKLFDGKFTSMMNSEKKIPESVVHLL